MNGAPDPAKKREKSDPASVDVEQRLHEMSARFESAFRSAPIGMALIDMQGQWLEVNDALCRMIGHTREELRATNMRELTHAEDADIDGDDRRQLLEAEITSYQIEKRLRHAWGHYTWVLLTWSLVHNQTGAPLYFIIQAQSISERKELEGHLSYLIDHDFLTGLYNRRRFDQELRLHVEEVARHGVTGAVLLIDLDHFKDVNDSFGHKAGDDLLKGIAGLLRQRTRRTDVLARLGGDEFGLLLRRADASQAEGIANEIVRDLHRHAATLGDEQVHISASVGIALFDGLSETEVLAYADLAMYEAKEEGRNRVAIFLPGRNRPRTSTRLADAERIRQALEQDRFFLHCQPIIDLSSGEIFRYELLLRLEDERGGEPLRPNTFLYSAERFGLIPQIDLWVVQQAVELIAAHMRAGRTLALSLNLSGKSIGDPKLAQHIKRLVMEGSIDPASLTFEVTETAAIANIEQAKNFAHEVRELGSELVLDDFGTGFNSFFYLKNLPFDSLKIDGDYIRDVGESPIDKLLVEAIVRIARGMGKKTVAEFVPGDDEVLDLLRTIGVDYAQGDALAPPMPVSEVLALK